MKSISLTLAAFSGLLLSNLAFANDTSFPMINVDAIETNAAVGTDISFTGEQASELLKLLPKVSSAGGPAIENHRRALLVRSPGYDIMIACRDYEYKDGKIVDSTPSCGIYFDHKNGDLNGFPFKANQNK